MEPLERERKRARSEENVHENKWLVTGKVTLYFIFLFNFYLQVQRKKKNLIKKKTVGSIRKENVK